MAGYSCCKIANSGGERRYIYLMAAVPIRKMRVIAMSLKRFLSSSIVLFAVVCFPAYADGHLPVVAPEEVGFDADRLKRIDTFFQQKVDDGELAGIVTLGGASWQDCPSQRGRLPGCAARDTPAYRLSLSYLLHDQSHCLNCIDAAV